MQKADEAPTKCGSNFKENEHKLFLLHSYGGSENYKYKKLDKKIT